MKSTINHFFGGAVLFAMAMRLFKTGFDLMIHDLYFTILAEIFASHILAENIHFTNHIE